MDSRSKTITDLEDSKSEQVSKRLEGIWSNAVDEIILNCETRIELNLLTKIKIQKTRVLSQGSTESGQHYLKRSSCFRKMAYIIKLIY